MKTLSDFRDIHKGQSIIVCGLGESIATFEHPEQFITIGVNDIGQYFDPDYLIAINNSEQFTMDRWQCIIGSKSEYLFSQYSILRPYGDLIQIKLGKRGGTDLSSGDSLPFTTNSPYVALCLAAFMGATKIGLIGVDFTGSHMLNRHVKKIDREYIALRASLNKSGVEVLNLSAASKLTAFPKISIEEFAKW